MSEATNLCLFFSLDNPLPAAGYLMVGIPSGASYTPTAAGVHVWPLTTSFAVPATAVNAGTCAWGTNVLSCTFATALTANTAYGMEIVGGAMAAAGTWAPVTMETRMNNAADAGPVMDRNRVFDSMNVVAAAATITMSAT